MYNKIIYCIEYIVLNFCYLRFFSKEEKTKILYRSKNQSDKLQLNSKAWSDRSPKHGES